MLKKVIFINTVKFSYTIIVRFYISTCTISVLKYPVSLIFSIFGNLIDEKWFVTVVLFRISLIISESNYLFIYVFNLCISSFVSYLFMFFARFFSLSWFLICYNFAF